MEIALGNRCLKYIGKRRYAHGIIPKWGEFFVFGEILNIDNKNINFKTNFSELFGRFVIVFSRLNQPCSWVVTDRYGLYPMYFRQNESMVLLSEEPFDFKAPRRSEADRLTSELLAFDQPLGQETYWESVTRFEPGSVTEFSMQCATSKSSQYWDKEGLIKNQKLRLEDCREALLDLFLEGCSYSSHSNLSLAVTLSGGLDSRLVLAGLLSLGKAPSAWTTGNAPNDAIRYSSELAMLNGTDHHVIPLSSRFLLNFSRLALENITRNSGLSLRSESEACWLRDALPNDTRLLHGAFGELYKLNETHDYSTRGLNLNASPEDGIIHFSRALQSRYTLRAKILLEVTGIELDLDIAESLRKRADRAPKLSSAIQLSQWLYIDEYIQKVTGNSLLMWSDRCSPVCPLSYPKFFDLLLSIRPEDRIDALWPIYALNVLSPRFLTIPHSSTHAKVGASKHEIFLRKTIRWANRRILGIKATGEHTDACGWLENIAPGFVELLDGSHISYRINRLRALRLYELCLKTRNAQLADALISVLLVCYSPQYYN